MSIHNRGSIEGFTETKNLLDKVSPSFCLAKWNQVTVHLSNGTTHSCHHCKAHTIPLDELKNNPSALHNTLEKKLTRKQMLNGERPKECDFCWRVEDLKEEGLFSDRIRKSNDVWNNNDIEEVPKLPWDVNATVRYLELDFSNACNFKCMYCSPDYSTTWHKEIKEFGPFNNGTTSFNSLRAAERRPQLEEEQNPYIAAFWKWLPDAVKELGVIRITGGEPLLSKNTFKLINYFLENPQPKLRFHVNSNLCVPEQSINEFIAKAKQLLEEKAVKEITVYTSGEAYAEKSEYIRFGQKYWVWMKNIEKILKECPTVRVTCMCTYNALSVSSFTKHIQALHKLVTENAHSKRPIPISLSVPYLRNPQWLSAWILTEDYIKYMEESVSYLEHALCEVKFPGASPYGAGAADAGILGEDDAEVLKPGFPEGNLMDLKRGVEVMKKAIRENVGRFRDVEIDRRAFHTFIDEFDRRRGTSFLSTFPEMAEFYHFCKNEYP